MGLPQQAREIGDGIVSREDNDLHQIIEENHDDKSSSEKGPLQPPRTS